MINESQSVLSANSKSRNFNYLDSESNKLKQQDKYGQRHLKIYIEGIRCAKCMFRLESLQESLEHLEEFRVNMGDHSAELRISANGSFASVMGAIEKLGFTPHPENAKFEAKQGIEKENRQLLMRVGVAGASMANIMLLSIAIYAGAEANLSLAFHFISFILFLPVLLYSAQPFFKNAYFGLRNARPSIDLPIAMALLIGGGLSTWHLYRGVGDIYYDSLVTLVFLLLSSRYFLARTQQKYLSPSFWRPFLDVKRVRRFHPETGIVEEIDVDLLKEQDLILVRKGEKIPIDGKLCLQKAYVNAAILTGESRPHKVLRGEMCFAGTLCTSSEIQLQTVAKGMETRVGQILTKMEKEFFHRTPLMELADRAAQVFTLLVLGVGSLFFLFYFQIDSSEAIRRSLALVVLACPCALAFATPLAQSLSLQVALRRGYMIKRAETLEKLAQVREVIFDKTGTLTQGEFELLKWVPRAPSPSILSAIWAVESQSEHPIARAFTHELNSYGNDKLHPTEVREKLGWGISAKLGQDSFLEIFRSELPPSNCDGPEDILVNTVDIRWNGSYQATAIFGDRLKADARETLQALKKEKIDCYLLTGDKGESSFSAAQKLGLSSEQFLFQQSPEQKNLFLKSRKFAAMVGDGANDALAMAASHVGIAVKGSMEVSLQAADVYLVKSGVNPVFRVIDLARKSMSIIRRNLYISLIYNLVCGAAALLGYINPLVAAVLMPINSLIVISSSIIGTQDFRPGLELNGHSKLGLTQDIPLDYRTQTA